MFLNWWLQQLTELLPPGLRGGGIANGDATILQIDRDSTTMTIRRKGHNARVARATPDEDGFRELAAIMAAMEDVPTAVIMRFSPSVLLRKNVTFPGAARRNLESLLGFEMDRETPFSRDEVHWTYRIDARNSSDERIAIDLLIVPRAHVEPAIEMARAVGLHPQAIEVETGPDDTVRIRIGVDNRWRRLRSDRRLMVFATTAGMLLLLALATPFIHHQLALSSADRRIKLLAAEAHEAAALRQSADQAASAINFINKERERDGSVLSALAVTTRLIPDDSHLTALSLRGGRLTISGLSPSAANIINLLARTPAFREPSFESPVVQDGGTGFETFTISATLTREPGS